MSTGDWITFTIDGREVRAPEGEWLLDAAKRGDVDVPSFCYEKKLGAPVRARSPRRPRTASSSSS